MRFAIIENSVVTNIILADQEFIDELGVVAIDVTDVDCNIGDMWNGTSFAPPAPVATVVTVPQAVTRRQALQQLIIEGLDDDVEAVLAGIPDITTRKLMTVWYRDSQVFERNRPEILQVWQALGRTAKQLDDTFIAASKL